MVEIKTWQNGKTAKRQNGRANQPTGKAHKQFKWWPIDVDQYYINPN